MKKVAIAALLLATSLGAPASAQYYGPRGGYDGQPGGYGGGYDDRRRGGYDDRRRGGYDDRRRGGDDDRRGASRRGSSVCVTSRGSCPIRGVVPRLTPCGCEVPGFGYKRGAAG